MQKGLFSKILSLTIGTILLVTPITGCGSSEQGSSSAGSSAAEASSGAGEDMSNAEKITLTIDEKTTYQTIESFGASGSWWSQYVGGWSTENRDGVIPREEIATLLFDDEKGIGLSAYRYNIGAGTADSGASYSGITDLWRRSESFETAPGVYDWTKDANAVWFLDKAVEMGVEELVFFSNSPLERLTKNGKGYGDQAANGAPTSNLSAENYRAFSEYVMDVVEHFVDKGYPIKYVSPVNEPQWDWTGGQEGCHYEPDELVDFLKVFLDVMEERQVSGVELSAPELGEWGNSSYPYYEAIFADDRLKNELTTLDVHSYWSNTLAKTSFMNWLEKNDLQHLELKMSEWCEMVNGRDLGMSSALNLALEMNTDLTKLNVTSWQYWIAVSCYNYRDGLVYVLPGNRTIQETKRLWAMGNFSRFIKSGYTRVECDPGNPKLAASAYIGKTEDGKDNLVVVLINSSEESYQVSPADFGGWTSGSVYVTDASHSLEKTSDVANGSILIPSRSVVTITLDKIAK